MLERDGYPAGVPCWVDTAQPDPEAAVRFYSGLFGWEFEDRMPADSPGRYFVARLRGRDVAAVGSQSDEMPPTPGWNIYVWVDSADETTAKAKEAGGTGSPGALRRGRRWPHGRAGRPRGRRVLRLGGEGSTGAPSWSTSPRTWNFNELNTRDPGGAQTFYRAVFGWEATTIVTGNGGITMFRRPGYGDFLAERDPDFASARRAPARPRASRTAVAWLVPMTNGQFPEDTPRTGAPPSRSTTPTRSPSRPRSSAARCWRRPSTPLGQDDGPERPSGRGVHGEQVRAGGLSATRTAAP